MSDKVTDEMLMALADGELDAATARDLAARVEGDPELSRRYAVFARSAEAARAAYADALREEPPAALADAIRRHGRPVARPGRGWSDAWQLPLAAGIALVAGLTGYVMRGADEGPREAGFAALDAAFAALSDAPSGRVVEIDGAQAVVLESYETAIGPCRLAQMRDRDGRGPRGGGLPAGGHLAGRARPAAGRTGRGGSGRGRGCGARAGLPGARGGDGAARSRGGGRPASARLVTPAGLTPRVRIGDP
jgi:hypothetical protein